MYGREAAAQIASFEASQVHAVKALVEKEKIDCDFNVTRAWDACLDDVAAKRSKEAFYDLIADDFPTMKDVYYCEGKIAEVRSGVKGAKSAMSFTVGSVWPYKLVLHLLSLAVKRGVNLQTHTPVTKVSETPDEDGRWTVETSRGVVKAKKVVFATNGYTSGVQPLYKERIVPVRGICSRVTVPEGKVAPHLPYSYSVRFPHFHSWLVEGFPDIAQIRHEQSMSDYQITRPDGSIIVGGGRPRFWHSHVDQWYNNTEDSKLIEPAVPHFHGIMQRTFSGWEHSDAELDRIWTGVMGVS